jgi:hypothetical protein
MKLTWSHILILNDVTQRGHSYQKHKVRAKQANGMS